MCSQEKSPWNPSKKATARVKNPLPAPTECCHCGSDVEAMNNSEIYGRSFGEWPWVYACTQCDSYIGMHPFTNIPLGTLADGPTRQARKNAKNVFNQLWMRSGRMDRNEAYSALADAMSIEREHCHFGWFDIEQCQQAQRISNQLLNGVRS